MNKGQQAPLPPPFRRSPFPVPLRFTGKERVILAAHPPGAMLARAGAERAKTLAWYMSLASTPGRK